MDKSSEFIDQIYERHSVKPNVTLIDPICDNCGKKDGCSEKAKKLALERDNECNSFC